MLVGTSSNRKRCRAVRGGGRGTGSCPQALLMLTGTSSNRALLEGASAREDPEAAGGAKRPGGSGPKLNS
eukprot:7367007-Lingulodinium_polyedra.AAC.1